jgi:hypothetical protein
MSRGGELSKRPERVIILDADDPLTEIHGRFVWQEEHDRVVGEVRRLSFAEGFQAGLREHTPSAPVPVVFRRRRTLPGYLRIAFAMLLGLFVLLMLPVIFL